MIRDEFTYRGYSFRRPPYGVVAVKTVVCDKCRGTIGIWLPEELPSKYIDGSPHECGNSVCTMRMFSKIGDI